MILNLEQKEKVPILGRIILAIGDIVIEVQKGKVTLKSGKEEDVLKVLDSNNNPSPFIFSYFTNAVITDNFDDLRMQDPLKKYLVLQDPVIVVGDEEIKIPQYFEINPPLGKRKNQLKPHG